MTKTYNINELLERKKHLDEQISESISIRGDDLTYREEKTIDRLNSTNNRVSILKQKVTLDKFSQTINGYIDELAKTKIVIQTYNSGEVSKLLQKRDSVRTKIRFLKKIKMSLPKDTQNGRKVISQDSNNVPIEIAEITVEPMFEFSDVEKQLNELSAEERKLNTEIQKLNLNAEITL